MIAFFILGSSSPSHPIELENQPTAQPSESGHRVELPESSTVPGKLGGSRRAGLHVSVWQPSHQPRVIAQRTGIVTNTVKSKQRKQKLHTLSKNSLRRSNKVNHYESSCKRQRRKHYMFQPSGRCNDRKCQ